MKGITPRRGFLLVLSALAVGVGVVVASAGAAAPASPPGCNADNSVVNIARSQSTAVVGETVSFSVSSGNPTTVDGCDIVNRVIRLTLPDGTFQDFGPFSEPNGTPVTTRGSLTYVTKAADLVDGQWNATAHATGTQLNGFDSASTADKATAINQLVPATTLTASASNPTSAHAGDKVTITVTESNTGQVALHNVSVTGTPADCATFTPPAGFSGNLAVGDSAVFTCLLTVGAAGSDTAWTALGNGLDTQNNPVPDTNEHQAGSVHAINPATTLSVVGNPPTQVQQGTPVTITVHELNSGDDPLTNVSVTGSPCATWTPPAGFSGNLGVGQSADFTCTFTVNATTVNWEANGQGTDSLGAAVPTAGEHQAGSVAPQPPQGIIAPTQTSCSDFTGGTASILGQVNYSVSGGKIGQGINPGVFFFYTKITTSSPNQVVTVTETNTSTNGTPNFGILNGQAWLYPASCASHTVGSTSGPNGENASFTVAVPGTYVIGIKYQTKTIAGAPAPVPADVTYNFNTSLGGSTGASVLLKKQ